MIQLTRLNGSHIVINALLIQQIETTPDTIVTLTTGSKVVVQESSEQIIEQAVGYLQRLHGNEEGDEAIAAGQWGRVV